MALKELQIRNLRPKAAIFQCTDDRGLYLEVHPNGSKLWRYKYRHAGKQKRLALGRYPDVSRSLARKKVTVCDYPDGRLEIRHEGVSLSYRIFDKLRQVHQAAIVDPKRLGAALKAAQEMQAADPPGHRNRTPTRRSGPQPVHHA